MWSDAELEALLQEPESDRVERKRSAKDRKAIRRAICAFANDLPGHGKPGVIFIGLEDDGSCAPIEVTDRLLRDLASIREEGKIQPLPSLSVERRTLRGCPMAVVSVEPAQAPPVRLDGRAWVRVGPTTRTATPEEERRLSERRRAADLPFDLRPVLGATIEDMDLDLFGRTYLPEAVAPDFLERNTRSVEHQLMSLRFTAPNRTPTGVGILAVGRDPSHWIPGAYVQFLRIDGERLSDPLRDEKRIEGPLPELMRRLEDLLEAHNEVAVDLTAGRTEERRPSYPLRALQQITRNAILHRTYEGSTAPVRVHRFNDRVEVHSPGGPYGQVTVENFGRPGITDYRNPHLAEAMRVLGYVQRFGVGLQIARDAMEENGNPPIEFEVRPTHVAVTLRRRP